MDIFKFVVKCGVIVIIAFVFNVCFVDDVNSYTRIMMDELYEDGPIDILFLGASHTYRSFNTELIEHETGMNAFNAGSSSQHLQGSYYLLKEAYESNGVKTVFLDVTYIMQQFEEPGEIETYLVLDYMRGFANRISYAWDVFGVAGVDDLFLPVLHSMDVCVMVLREHVSDSYWNNSYEHVTYNNEAYMGQGFVYSYEVVSDDYQFTTTEIINDKNPITEFALKYLYKIIDYCKLHEIELIFINPPMPDATLIVAGDFDSYVKTINEIACEKGVKYWDFNLITRDFLSMQRSDYKDADHLNGQGADKFSKAFCELLKIEEPVFYDSFEEKIKNNPDGSYSVK